MSWKWKRIFLSIMNKYLILLQENNFKQTFEFAIRRRYKCLTIKIKTPFKHFNIPNRKVDPNYTHNVQITEKNNNPNYTPNTNPPPNMSIILKLKSYWSKHKYLLCCHIQIKDVQPIRPSDFPTHDPDYFALDLITCPPLTPLYGVNLHDFDVFKSIRFPTPQILGSYFIWAMKCNPQTHKSPTNHNWHRERERYLLTLTQSIFSRNRLII